MSEIVDLFLLHFKEKGIAVVIDDLAHEPHQLYSALICPAQTTTAEKANQIAHLTGGLFMVSVSQARADALQLQPMPKRETIESEQHLPPLIQSLTLTGMLASVEARHNVTTGISAADRAETLKALGAVEPNPRSIVSPGHIFPILTKSGGILERPALAEAALDCVTLAGFTDASLWVTLIDHAGKGLNETASITLAQEQQWPFIKISDLLRYRLTIDATVREVAHANLPTAVGGDFRAFVFHSDLYQGEHIALVHGDITKEPVLTRVQAESTLSDVFGGKQSRAQLDSSLEKIKEHGQGVLIYLRRTAAGILAEELSGRASSASRMTLMRNYGVGAQIIRALGIKKINLLTTSQKSIEGLELFGVQIVGRTYLGQGNS